MKAQLYKLWASRFLRSFSHYKSMGAINPPGMVRLGSRGLTGRIYVGDLKTVLPTKYTCCRPHGFKEEYFNKVYGSFM